MRVWNPSAPQSVATLPTHACTYSAQFSPHSPSVISAASADSTVRIFDLRTHPRPDHLVLAFPNHGAPAPAGGAAAAGQQPAEVLTHDWNKYRDGVVATAGVDPRRALLRHARAAPGSPTARSPATPSPSAASPGARTWPTCC